MGKKKEKIEREVIKIVKEMWIEGRDKEGETRDE